jgi:two-component system nitrate/nitrite response regulator NarL
MTAHQRVAIVEDHLLLAQSVGLALRAEGLEVVTADLTGERQLYDSLAPDADLLVLLDLDLGEPIVDGTNLIGPLRARGAQVLVVTGTTDRLRIAAALEAGALGFVGKHQPFDELLETLLRAVRGENVIGVCERHELLGALRMHRQDNQRRLAPFHQLTPKESLVLDELTQGKSVDSIAGEWVVSEATVRTQVRGVLTKLDVRSQLAAVAKARAAGWRS